MCIWKKEDNLVHPVFAIRGSVIDLRVSVSLCLGQSAIIESYVASTNSVMSNISTYMLLYQ